MLACALQSQSSSPSSGVVPAPGGRSKSSFTSSSGSALAPAVDMQQLAGQPNTYVVCVPGLHNADVTTRQVAQRLAASLGGRWTDAQRQQWAPEWAKGAVAYAACYALSPTTISGCNK